MFRHQLTTEIEIEAPTDVVWEILTDLPAYADWNPLVVESAGEVAVGQRLVNRLQAPGGRVMTFKPTVTEVATGRVFEWLGRLLLPGLFDGRHRFELHRTPSGGTRFVHAEGFRGVLVPLMKRSLDRDSLAGFEAMNAAIKTRAETRVACAGEPSA